MRIKGEKPGINSVVIPIPREGKDFIIIATAVQSYAEFDKLVDEPKPPNRVFAGDSTPTPDFKDKGYLDQIKNYNSQRWTWMMIESIRNTPDLEFEKVVFDQPETWKQFEPELKESGFSQNEIAYIMSKIVEVNGLSERMLEEARQRFLVSQREAQVA